MKKNRQAINDARIFAQRKNMMERKEAKTHNEEQDILDAALT